ncbi:hypothetical protein ACT4UT_29150, partial [Bacillus sp. B-TM1]
TASLDSPFLPLFSLVMENANEAVEEMVNRVKPLQFNRLYNAFHRVVKENANEAVERSAERYIKAIEGKLFHT